LPNHHPDFTQMPGILSDEMIQSLIETGGIRIGDPVAANQVQPASLDLRLGSKALRVRASFMPGHGTTVQSKLDDLKLHEIDITNGAVLETGCVYVVPLIEMLHLPQMISAAANPKSSTGRLDIFTRVMVDGAQEFDKIPAGYSGQLYLEISPRTFPIIVRRGSRLTQIRFRSGPQALFNQADVEALHASDTLLAGGPLNASGGGVALSIDLVGNNDQLVGYRGKKHAPVIDVDRVGAYDIFDFWEPIHTRGKPQIILDPDAFYILVSREAVHVPPMTAAEMTPFDPLVGEFRVHYAGFFDPGFGHAAAGGTGSRAVLEVRSHEVPFILEHGQIVGRLVYEKMAKLPSALYGGGLKSNYQAQGLKLSKHFRQA
jgi:dCTP deaminase